MKNVVTVLFLFYTSQLFAQYISEDKVPPLIVSAFKRTFSNASELQWGQDGLIFNSSFKIDDKWNFVKYSSEGTILLHDATIDYDRLPILIKSAVSKQFAGYQPHSVIKIDSIISPIFYEVVMEKNKEYYFLKYSSVGELVVKEKKKY